MNNLNLINSIEELSIEEQVNIEGGILPILLAVGAGCAAGLAIYEAGKAVGEFAYWASH